MDSQAQPVVEKVPTYCYQCVAGPDLLRVKVVNGVATEIEPNFDAAADTPAGGRVCVKAYGLIQKLYSPNRITRPMKRTNPAKGRDQDPGFVPIGWDEALDMIAGKVRDIHAQGARDASGYPRIAASFGGGGTPTYYMGTFPALLSAIGPVDMSLGSGQGVKCYHSEHLYGELWHRAFIVAPDTPLCNYILSFGSNVEASGGVCGVRRHAEARSRGARRVQIEPHLSITGACSAQWVPIRPKTDPAFMFALINVLVHERRDGLDHGFLRARTNSPYLIAPNGYFLRDPASSKPLIFDLRRGRAVPFDSDDAEPALAGRFIASGIELGADDDRTEYTDINVATSFQHLAEHVAGYTPEWAGPICDVDPAVIRRIALEYLEHAQVGATTEIEGRRLPLRPVAIVLGKTVNNGWGGYHCCWARTWLACLVGALEVPGGTIGTTIRLTRPADDRNRSVRPCRDGFMEYPMNPTRADQWQSRPDVRNANRMLVPLVANSSWSQALGPTHLAWMQQNEPLEHMPAVTAPDLWFVYRTNPAISFWDTPRISNAIARFPFVVCFAYTHDETNHMADLLLPDATDLEGLQLIRIGGTKFVEQFWDKQGFALRQPVGPPQGDSRDFTWIATQIARRCGVLEKYNAAINHGAAGISLSGPGYDFALDPAVAHEPAAIWDAACRAASAEVSEGAESQGLEWYREHGYRLKPFSRIKWYLTAALEDQDLRYEMPYQERLLRIGQELGRRLHDSGINWWDEQLTEYEALPDWKDFPRVWERALTNHYKVNIDDFPFWLVTSRSMQYAWGSNAAIPMIREVARNVRGHTGLVINAGRARELGLADGDLVEIRSPLNATRGQLVTRQGIRPDTVLLLGQFDHWATPVASKFRMPSMNALVPMLMDLTDSTGSGADLVRVQIRRLAAGE